MINQIKLQAREKVLICTEFPFCREEKEYLWYYFFSLYYMVYPASHSASSVQARRDPLFIVILHCPAGRQTLFINGCRLVISTAAFKCLLKRSKSIRADSIPFGAKSIIINALRFLIPLCFIRNDSTRVILYSLYC